VSEPDELLGILRLAVHNHLVVYVRTRGAPGASEKTDLRLRLDPLTHRNGAAMHVRVEGSDAVAVVNLDDLAVRTPIAGAGHDPRRRGINRRHIGCVEVQPGVKCNPPIKRIAPRTEAASNLVML
jgi:hypothetical protein